MHGRTDGQRENSIPPTNKVCGGIIIGKNGHFPIIPLQNCIVKTFESHNIRVLVQICVIIKCVIKGLQCISVKL